MLFFIKFILSLIFIPMSFIGLGLLVGAFNELPSSLFIVLFFLLTVSLISLIKAKKRPSLVAC